MISPLTIISLMAAVSLVTASPQIITGPGPVVTVTLCHTVDGESTCTTSPLSAGNCIDLATSAPAFDNSVETFSVGPVFATAPKINCTLHDQPNCGAAGHLNDRVVALQSPGGDVEADFQSLVSSYLCD